LNHTPNKFPKPRETTRSLDEIVWAVNPFNDTPGRAGQLRLQIRAGIPRAGRIALPRDVPAQLPAITIPPEVRHNIFLAFKKPSTTWSNTRKRPKSGAIAIAARQVCVEH